MFILAAEWRGIEHVDESIETARGRCSSPPPPAVWGVAMKEATRLTPEGSGSEV